jgi:hypothetical protein
VVSSQMTTTDTSPSTAGGRARHVESWLIGTSAILDSLKHRNIVQLIQKIKDVKNERIYIVMEVGNSPLRLLSLVLPYAGDQYPPTLSAS